MAFLHKFADVSANQIGENTKIWQFAIILEGAIIGDECNICAHTYIEGNVIVGDRVTIKSGVFLWDGARIGNDVFLGPNATFTNDKFPRSKKYPDSFSNIIVEDGATIGANSTLLPGIKVGKKAMVGAGAVVTKDVPAYAIVRGNPASVFGFVSDNCK